MKVLVLYDSLSGNTKSLANMINALLHRQEIFNTLVCDINNFRKSIPKYDLVFIGSYTWGNGELPNSTREFLKWLLKENEFDLPLFSVFGTGDTQWTYYCRAVDEVEYHLSKKTKVVSTLKIEQHPINQKSKVEQYIRETLKEVKDEAK